MFLPIDVHIIEYSKLKELIEEVPEVLKDAKQRGEEPYLPIQPKSYRKQWQYDDEAYNYVYDFLSAFTEFDFPEELQQSLNASRLKVASENTSQELLNFLLQGANDANQRRFQTIELENIFLEKVEQWRENKNKVPSEVGPTRKDICIGDDY